MPGRKQFVSTLPAALFLLCLCAGCGDSVITPYQPEVGSLRVVSTPDHARIYLQSSYSGVLTPYTFTSIKASPIQLRLRLEGYEDFVQMINVPGGERLDVTVTLKPAYVRSLNPDSVLVNIASAFGRRDADSYGALLSDGFVFRPDSVAAAGAGPDSLGAEAERVFAHALLDSTAAISASLTLGLRSQGVDARPEHEGWQWREVYAELSVTRPDHSTLHLAGKQRLYFRPTGNVARPWQLAEWVDLEVSGPGRPLTWSALRLEIP